MANSVSQYQFKWLKIYGCVSGDINGQSAART